MKKFVTCIFLVSLVFLGIGNIANSVKAGFESDEKALQLIRAAKVAIGGDASLAEVKGMTIKANETIFIDTPEIQDTMQGSLEINFELPGRYSKRIKMGGDSDLMSGTVNEDIDIVIDMKEKGALKDLKGRKGVFIVKKDENGNPIVDGDENGRIEIKEKKILIKKDDGTVEEIDLDDAKNEKVIIKSTGDGETIDLVGEESGDNTWVTKDGKKFKFKAEKLGRGAALRGSEMARMTMALIMNAPLDGSYSYKYVGLENIDGYPSNAIDVTPSRGDTFRLFLDAGSSLPRAISYKSHEFSVFVMGEKPSREQLIEMKKKAGNGSQRLMKFDDFRSVGNLNLPHRWTEMADNKILRTIDVTSMEINPADLSQKFGKKARFLFKEKKID